MIRWLGSLFRPEPERPVLEPEPVLPSPVDDGFQSAYWVIEQAFEQIMADVDAPSDAKRHLLSLYTEAHRTGDPRHEAGAVETAFQGIEWGHEYFGRWHKRFSARGEFPYMWCKYPDLCSGDPPPPGTVAEALEYLRVPEMRRLAIELGVMPSKPRPRKRTEFVALLKHTDVPAPILDAAMVRFGEQMQARRDRIERARYDLLAHTLTMRVYKLRKMADWSRLRPHEPGCRLRAMQSHCPIESEYVAKFNAGELTGLPPYFPDDRTGLVLEWQDHRGRS